eukprot:727315-Amphidinium_carterae.1
MGFSRETVPPQTFNVSGRPLPPHRQCQVFPLGGSLDDSMRIRFHHHNHSLRMIVNTRLPATAADGVFACFCSSAAYGIRLSSWDQSAATFEYLSVLVVA